MLSRGGAVIGIGEGIRCVFSHGGAVICIIYRYVERMGEQLHFPGVPFF